MALPISKHVFLKIFLKNVPKSLSPILGARTPSKLSSVNYSVEYDAPNQKINKAMASYLERAKKYEALMQEQLQQYDLGKKHLANIMGKRGKNMTQEEIDEAIEYLFPSGLYSPIARPLMKHPSEVFSARKEVEFDITGRPFHFLFYTAKPSFSEILHNAAKKLEELNNYEAKMILAKTFNPEKKLILPGEWISREDLEKKLVEFVFTAEYEKFLEVFERLLNHPYGYMEEEFIKKYRIVSETVEEDNIPKPAVAEDGTLLSNITGAKRKHAIANVTVKYPGKGSIQINHTGLNYFINIQSREQVLFPLLFTEMESKVDVVANVEKGGEVSQAGAIRLGISLGLLPFVDKKTILKMKLAGLLQKDFRRAERKKPGKKKARRRYTWLKR